jgi:Uma2 family endonuclease
MPRGRQRGRSGRWWYGFAMVATRKASKAAPALPEQRMLIYGVSWKDYVILREALDTPGLRMTYCEGALELMTPSRAHELSKKTIARFIEAYALLRRLPLLAYGSPTFRREAKERAVEPDECWCVRTQMREGEYPHIVLEVIYTNPLLDKLEVYDGFGVPEVWLWREGAFELYHRRPEGGYERVERSRLLPELDFGLIAPFVTREDQDVAVFEFADLLQSR